MECVVVALDVNCLHYHRERGRFPAAQKVTQEAPLPATPPETTGFEPKGESTAAAGVVFTLLLCHTKKCLKQ